MTNVWTCSLIFAYFCIPPVASLLSLDGQGRPLPFGTLVKAYGMHHVCVTEAVEREIWRVGMTVMMQYCDHLACQNPPKFVKACTDKVKVNYVNEFGNTDSENLVSGNNFPTADLDRYLKHIRQDGKLKNIITNLKEAMVKLGWSEMCEYCNIQGRPPKTEECYFACANDLSENPRLMGQYNGRPPLQEIDSSSGSGSGSGHH